MKIFNKTTKKEEETDKSQVSAVKKKDVKSDTKKNMKDLYAGDGGKTKSKNISKNEDKEVKAKRNNLGMAYRVLVKPLITEKASKLGELSKYFFAVARDANKIEISKAVLEVYGIKPTAVNVVSMKGKKTRNGKIIGKRKDWKKAIVTLPKGKTINIYEGV